MEKKGAGNSIDKITVDQYIKKIQKILEDPQNVSKAALLIEQLLHKSSLDQYKKSKTDKNQ